MLPTLNASGDIVLMEHWSPWLGDLKEGDIVVAKSPTNPRMTICKRILGMPGDTLFMSPQSPLDLPKPVTVRPARPLVTSSITYGLAIVN